MLLLEFLAGPAGGRCCIAVPHLCPPGAGHLGSHPLSQGEKGRL